ncbi:MAG TPA: PQQ-binding-like beta-propeller repeat protein [Candidatus Limnocylindrales bacterium]|nr:PQQ-binding-like beta-propeller repeat protein [Candidatus Limnocylindrales bacterium]
MNETSTFDQPAPGEKAKARSEIPRLRLPSMAVLLYWIATFVLAAIDKPYFFGFMFGLLTAILLTLVVLGWWWFNRAVRLRDKALGFAFLLAEAILVGRLADRSISPFTLWMSGFPLVATLVIAWLLIAKSRRIAAPRRGLAIAVTVAWAYFLVIRIDGADSRLKFKSHWRWTPTPEQEFLANAKTVGKGRLLTPAKEQAKLEPLPGDWTCFRGPERDGVIRGSNISTNWSVNPPTLVWKHSVGPAWSALLVVGPRLYTQEQRGTQEAIVCYDAETGEQIWVHEDVARFDEQVSGPGPRATPTFADGRLYVVGGTGLLNCLDASTGASLWQQDIKGASDAKLPMWAFSGSPLVTGDLVIVYAGGEAGKGLLAYRAQTGELAWTTAAGNSTYSSPQITTIAGVPQCLMLHDSGLTSVDVATGKKLWATGTAMKGAPRTGQPRLIEGNKLLVAALGGLGCSLIEVTKTGEQWSAADKWESKGLKPEFPDLVVHKGFAYGFDVGIFCCINLADGKRCWKDGRYGRGQVVLLADQQLLLVSTESGQLVLLAPDPTAHKELASFQAIEGKTWNYPLVRGNRVYLRNAQEMACYSLSGKSPRLAGAH